jgi:uncharacterized membrane protein
MKNRTRQSHFWISLCIILTALGFTLPARAQSLLEDQGFTIEQFTTEIRMNPDSSLDIVETIEVNFSEQRHGIFRDIRDEGIDVDIIDITNEAGKAWKYALESEYLTTRVRIGNANKYVTGRQIYRIHYVVYDAILYFETHNELYWNATGAEWPVLIRQAKTIVSIPEYNPNVQFRCFTGPLTSQEEDCSMAFDGRTITYTANTPLDAFEGLTIVAGIPRGHITPPATLRVESDPQYASVSVNGEYMCETNCTLERLAAGAHSITLKRFGYQPYTENIILKPGYTQTLSASLTAAPWFRTFITFLQILFFLVAVYPIYRFIKYGKDPKGRSTIIAEYGPPDNLSPSEMGTLVDERADLHDISATIINLAVRGFLKIRVLQDKKTLFKSPDYEFIRQKKTKAGETLIPFEQKIMNSIFGGDTKKKLSDLENKFYSKLPKLKEELYANLVEKAYFERSPEKVRKSSLRIAFGTIGAGLILIPLEAIIFGSVWSFSIIINGIVALTLHRYMPKKTKKGMLAYQHVLGFKEYLRVAERYRLKFEEKENLFFEYLPYAMTLGVAKKWSKAFKNIYDNPPEWIEGIDGKGFKSADFLNSMTTITNSITQTIQSRPAPPTSSRSTWSGSASSGSSGFSSGGFSGGGFGGGGGGSW